MRPRNNILPFIAAVLISVQTFPLNIGRGSNIYDPDSIPQNERILRLFLHLASHTANKLIHLKNEAKLQKPSNPVAEAILPAVCRRNHDNHRHQRFRGRGHHEDHLRPIHTYRQTPLRIHFKEKSKVPLNPFHKLNPTSSESIDKVVGENEDLQNQKKFNDPHGSIYNASGQGLNDQQIEIEANVGNSSLKNRKVIKEVEDKSDNLEESSLESPDDLANSLTDNGSEDSDDGPIEIASRALFNVEKNNNVSNYNDKSKNVNNDTRVNNTKGSNVEKMGIPQSGPAIINQNSGDSEFQGNKQENNTNQVNTGIDDFGAGSSGSEVGVQNTESMALQNFQNSTESTIKVESTSSSANHQFESSKSSQMTKSVGSNLEPRSSGLERTGQSVKSGSSDFGGSEIAGQVMNATSGIQSGSSLLEKGIGSLESMSSGVVNSSRDGTSEIGSAGMGILTQDQTAASQFDSRSSELLKSGNGGGLDSESAGAGISTQAQNASSQVQTVSSEILNSANGVASKIESTGAEISTQAQNGSSPMQSISSEMMNAANGGTSKAEGTGAEILTQAQKAVSQVESVSGILNSANGVASKTESTGAEILTQGQNASSPMQSMSSGMMNAANGAASKAGNTGAEIPTQAQKAFSQVESVSGILNSANLTASKTESTGAEISTQVQNASSPMQSMSSGMMNAANGAASKAGSTGAEIPTQAQKAFSQVESVSGILNSANLTASKTESTGAEISTQVQNASSPMQSMSSGIINAANGGASKAGSTGAEIPTQAHKAVSQVETVSSGIMNATNGIASTTKNATIGSKISKQIPTVKQANLQRLIENQVPANKNRIDHEIKALQANQRHKTFENLKQSGMLSEIHSTTEKIGNLLQGLGGDASRFIGSVIRPKGSELGTATETSFKRENAPSSLLTSGRDGFNQVGSSLIGSLPLFRSFPDVYEQSSTVKQSSLGNQSKNDQSKLKNGRKLMTGRNEDEQGLFTKEDKLLEPKKSLFGSHSKKNQSDPTEGQIFLTERNLADRELLTNEDKSSEVKKSSLDDHSKKNESDLTDGQLLKTERNLADRELFTNEDKSSEVKKSSLDGYSKKNRTKPTDGQTLTTERNVDDQELSTIGDKNLTMSDHTKESNDTTTKSDSSLFYDEYANYEEGSELELEEYTNRFADALRPVKFSQR